MKRDLFRLLGKLRNKIDGTNLRLLSILLLLVLVFGYLEGKKLFAPAGFRSMAFQLPELGMLSLAMMIPMLSGGINLSIIATANLCSLSIAYILTTWFPGIHGSSMVLFLGGSILIGVFLSAIVGVINGYMVAYLRVPPMLATLGTMTAVKGVSIGFSHGSVISGFQKPIVFIGQGNLFEIPVVLIIFIVIAIPLSIFINRTPLGISIAMIGSNEQASQFSGINTRRSLMWIYVLSALLSAVAGIIMMARFNSANAAYGESYLLIAILAAVLGGVSPLGGFGKVSGVILSLIILQIMSTASILLDLSQFITLTMWGAILLLASGVTVFSEWISERKNSFRSKVTKVIAPEQ